MTHLTEQEFKRKIMNALSRLQLNTYQEMTLDEADIESKADEIMAKIAAHDEQVALSAKHEAYVDCRTKAGTGKQVRAYAKSREELLSKKLEGLRGK